MSAEMKTQRDELAAIIDECFYFDVADNGQLRMSSETAADAILAAGWARTEVEGCHGLDTPERVRFYEHDFYPLSNFSAFRLNWRQLNFETSEAAYHWEKFPLHASIRYAIRNAPSAHEAFKIAEANRALRRSDWDNAKVGVMRDILRAKADQHEYVRRKLLATGNRELVEDSWRDDFWGWGPNRDGLNMLGKLWMEIRDAMLAAAPLPPQKENER